MLSVLFLFFLVFNIMHYFEEGSSLRIECMSKKSNYYAPKFWNFNQGKLPENAVVVNYSSLVFSNMEVYNEGKYVCEGDSTTSYYWFKKHIPYAVSHILKLKGNEI